MRHRLSFSVSLALFGLPLVAAAQGPFTGKPLYAIEARRAGVALGTVRVEMFPAIAPRHVRNWDSLVQRQFYDSTAFHRVIPGFVIQGGDPNSRRGPRNTWGYGQPNQPKVRAEFSAVSHERGILSAARDTDPNSADSQFFICVAAARSLNRQYSVYGRVTSGMAIVDQIVRAPRDGNDNPLQKIEMFVTRIGSNDTVARAPQLRLPLNGSGGAPERPVLRWQSTADAQLYRVQISTDSLFATPTAWVVDTTISALDTAFTAPALAALTRYFWRVSANNGGSVSPWGQPWVFRTGAAAPTLLSPTNNSIAGPATPVLMWSAVPNATSYQVQVARSRLFQPAQIVFDQTGILGSQWQTPAGLAINQRYYWRVRAFVGTEAGYLSADWNFRPSFILAVADERAATFAWAPVVPNPVSAAGTTLAFTLDRPDLTSLTVVDALGRAVAQPLAATQLAAGDHEVQMKTDALAPGMYLLHLRTGETQHTQRVVVK
jgi:peptidyl-prolyl cis-trans isomerase B (cyclophilin B)